MSDLTNGVAAPPRRRCSPVPWRRPCRSQPFTRSRPQPAALPAVRLRAVACRAGYAGTTGIPDTTRW